MKHWTDSRMHAELDQAVEQAALESAQLFDELRAPWPQGAVERDTYGAGDQYAHDLIARQAQAMALETRLQLYLQERDKPGAKVYQELKKMMQNKTVAQIEKMGDPVTS